MFSSGERFPVELVIRQLLLMGVNPITVLSFIQLLCLGLLMKLDHRDLFPCARRFEIPFRGLNWALLLKCGPSFFCMETFILTLRETVHISSRWTSCFECIYSLPYLLCFLAVSALETNLILFSFELL